MKRISFESGVMLGFPCGQPCSRWFDPLRPNTVPHIPSFAANVMPVAPILVADSVHDPRVVGVSRWELHLDPFRCSLGYLYALQRARVVIGIGFVDSIQDKD